MHALSEPTVRALLEHGAYVESEDRIYQECALALAGWRGHAGIIRTLLAWKAGRNKKHLQTAFHNAMVNGHGDVASLFIEAGLKIGLAEAIWMGDKAAVQRLLFEEKADNNHLVLAAEWKRLDIVRLLLQYGADPNAERDSRTALSWAHEHEEVEIQDVLLEAGADAASVFTMFPDRQHLNRMRKMAAYGADVDIQNCDGHTALIEAARNGELAVVQFLLTKGANVHLHDNEERTALFYAVEQGHTTLVRLLLAYGADANLRDFQGWTPLELAERWPGKKIMSFLKANGALR